MLGRLFRLFGNLLTVAGVLLLIGVVGTYGYGLYERYVFEAAQASQQAGPAPASSPSAAITPTDSPPPTENPSEQSPPTATPEVKSLPATHLRIPSIGVDSPVVEAPVDGGEWKVPKFVVGHLEGTAHPKGKGNAVYSGHVESIASGNVFANLGRIKVGDLVEMVTEAETLRYRVTEVKVVENTDVEVLRQTADPRITLITCAGTWDISTRDYSHRLVVVATPEESP
ncbi:MAG: sortase [Chloroflexota bacterium]